MAHVHYSNCFVHSYITPANLHIIVSVGMDTLQWPIKFAHNYQSKFSTVEHKIITTLIPKFAASSEHAGDGRETKVSIWNGFSLINHRGIDYWSDQT